MKPYDTANINSLRFRPHGNVEISMLEDHILVYKAHGPFNTELAKALAELEEEAYPELKARWGYWGDICVFVDSCLVLDEAAAFYENCLSAFKRNGQGPSVSAFIYPPELEGKLIAEQTYRKIFENAGVLYSSFTDFGQGAAWVKRELTRLERPKKPV